MSALSDPQFRTGYFDAWNGEESQVQSCWDHRERRCYEQGRAFALWLQNAGEGRIVLSRGGMPNTEAAALLARARNAGALDELAA